jgi:hypothetical protein
MVVADGKRWKVTAFLTKTAENAAWILSSQGQVIGYRAEKKDEESKDFAADGTASGEYGSAALSY